MITSKELRDKWIKFYEERGHVNIGAVSLIGDGTTGVMPTCPIEMDSVGPIKTKPAPYIGANTAEVAKSLGYTDEQIAAMIASGAIK